MDYEYFLQRSNQTNSMYQLFDGIEEIKIQGCTKRKSRDFKRIYKLGLEIGIKRLSIFQVNRIGATLINQGRDIIITIITSLLVIRGEQTLGVLLAVQYVIGQLDSPVDQLVNFVYKIQDLSIDLHRITTIYTEEEEINKDSKDFNIEDDNKNIYINNVSYKYNVYSKANILDKISFVIPQGKMTAIVGLSGSGKTTLLKLLLGYDNPTEGEILIGEHKITDINIEDWRKNCGVVMQDGYIFADTIENNIKFGNPAASHEEVVKAAQKACCHEFIMSLPDGYGTVIGEGGATLSGGEKQRISIARAILKDSPIIILDEATSSVDPENENLLMGAISELTKNKTVIMIAHRLKTVRNADQIFVLSGGHIVQTGKHEDLIRQPGIYADFIGIRKKAIGWKLK